MTRTRRKTNGSTGTVAAAAATPDAASSPQEGRVGLLWDQLDMSLQSVMARAVVGWRRMRKVQWQMTAPGAEARRGSCASAWTRCKDWPELMALQVELMRFDSVAAIKTGQGLYDAAVQNTTEALTRHDPPSTPARATA